MRSLSELSSTEFSNGLTSAQLRTGMIIQAALGIGPLFFFMIVLFVAFQGRPDVINSESIEAIKTLTVVDIFFFIISSSIGTFVYRKLYSANRLESAYNNDLHDRAGNIINATPAEKAVTLIRNSMLMRTAFFELSATFGIVFLLVAANSGLLLSLDWIWINAIPLMVHLIVIIVTFPTKERILSIFEEHIKGIN